MTDESDRTPRRSRRKRRRDIADAIDAAMADRPTVSPPLNPGPGRTRILDPDQATLDENVRRLYAAASVQATLDEMAGLLGVSLDTLRDFFHRYPTVKERCDDYRRAGAMSIRTQLFKNLTGDGRNRPDPETARWMADRMVGIQDPYKLKDLDLRERAFAQHREESERTMELKKQELAQREREILMKEQELALKVKDLGPGPPIDVRSLSETQLVHLLERIKFYSEANEAGRAVPFRKEGITFQDVKSLS